jgi:hypothetical protein
MGGSERGMRTEDEDHQVPETNEAGCHGCTVSKARHAALGVSREDMAVLCLLDGLRRGIDVLFGGPGAIGRQWGRAVRRLHGGGEGIYNSGHCTRGRTDLRKLDSHAGNDGVVIHWKTMCAGRAWRT